ncbi:fructuronate reductase [Sediminihabitans luteus]|uniref:Mannitol-1-phosphate 5-dehydrogenase n=1 Tax=Sediminihabitans luteus TaxID=1138585 RepID=A0A2M9D018_9CELL|nr:mannitol dehydrogenase family protein [Sediminihabitans luteus]PJJ77443.1 fructuronate reductase [Sediminihabitans luteus]GII98336.1 oxidoreductase [Sediminihabitans luteus]
MTTNDRAAALPRLDRSTVLPAGVGHPDPAPTSVGIVHLGIGAFHRAHQAVCTEDAARATGDTRWGILGVTQRSRTVVDQLAPQGGRYGLLSTEHDETSLRVVGAVVDVASPGETARVLETIAAPTTHVVTLTVTEKGYTRTGDGSLDLAAVRADLDALVAEDRATPATSAVGMLVRGLAARHAAARRTSDGLPLTVLSCDNLTDNGRVLGRLVREAVDAALPGRAGDPLRAWIAASVTFPCSMVDRIVPATTPAHHELAQEIGGFRDEGLVAAETFFQWVVEDDFAGPRPAWERAGATITGDVLPYERAKLRMLNGTHSILAYAGALAGRTTIAEVVGDAAVMEHADAHLEREAPATLDGSPLDLPAYAAALRARFANPATGHTTVQVAMDGTQKIPVRWGGVLAERVAAGQVPDGATYGLAAWALFVVRATLDAAHAAELADPRADELRALVRAADGDVEAAVRSLVALPGLLPDALGEHPDVVAAVLAHAATLRAHVPLAV